MDKNFDKWTKIKKVIDASDKKVFCNQREIWWCSL